MAYILHTLPAYFFLGLSFSRFLAPPQNTVLSVTFVVNIIKLSFAMIYGELIRRVIKVCPIEVSYALAK